MKKIKIKGWLENLLIIINIVCLILLGGDCDSLTLFFISKVILLGIFAINNIIIIKYGKLFEGGYDKN